MTVTRNENNDIVVTLSGDLDPDFIQQTINYLRYREATKNSVATQEFVDELSREINKNWWEKNKHKFLRNEVSR